jgi:peptidoglycan/xylan/chitin deacetylase (PgdA/CDA1 family)
MARAANGSWPEGIVSRVEDQPGMIALTFDDGPNVSATPLVREILNSHGALGTFFTVGKALDAEPALTLDLLRDGHVIANHSYNHDLRTWLSPETDELAISQDVFGRRTGVRPVYFRPPFGLLTRDFRRRIEAAGLICVTWDVAVEDWRLDDAAEIARRVLDAARPGSIVLLHDGHEGDVDADRTVIVDALPLILAGLRAKSLEPVGLDTLLEKRAYME